MRSGISVIVPTFNRPALLARCLQSLISQQLDSAQFEIIVCDDGPGEDTKYVVERMQPLSPVALKYIAVTETQGPAAARNAGARAARFSVLAFTDDDCIASDKWLASALRAFQDATVGAAAGKLYVPIPQRPTDYERNEAGLSRSEFVTANAFCRTAVFHRIGGFDPSFTMAWREDSDLHFRLLEKNIRIVHLPGAVICHPVRPGRWCISVFQQRKIMFDALLYKKHPRLYKKRISPAPPLLYYGVLVTFLAAVAGLAADSPAGSAAASVSGLFVIAFFLQRIRNNSRRFGHLAEMLLTSAAIPFVSVFWRLYGAWKFRVAFF